MKVADIKFIIQELKRAKEYNDKYKYADLHCVLINKWVFYKKYKFKKHKHFYTLFEKRMKLLIKLNATLITTNERFNKKEMKEAITLCLNKLIKNCEDEIRLLEMEEI